MKEIARERGKGRGEATERQSKGWQERRERERGGEKTKPEKM